MLADPSPGEQNLLGAFRYSRNLAVLHTDDSFMPKRRAVWSSWNYIGSRDVASDGVCVTYWMNRLQNIESEKPLFVTLNPPRPPRAGTLLHSEVYDHPIFDAKAIAAQRKLWLLQGETEYVVLRRLFRRWLSRRRIAGRARRRRAARRRATALAGAKRVRPYRPYGAERQGRRNRSCRYDASVIALCRFGHASAAASTRASISLPRVLVPARSR